MSYIPSSAMPHAHTASSTPEPAKTPARETGLLAQGRSVVSALRQAPARDLGLGMLVGSVAAAAAYGVVRATGRAS